jgi:probable selenium-dependent hydroxylase accessory protein YqeC
MGWMQPSGRRNPNVHSWNLNSNLLDLLHARAGLVCLVGAGGKKTTQYRLAAAHSGRVGITSTVYTQYFPKSLNATEIVREVETLAPAVVQAAATARVIAFAHPSAKPQRFAGLSPSLVTRIQQAGGFDVMLIKCDGARGRRIKAPNASEPLIPEAAATVIPVVSVRAIGQVLSEHIAHRPERIAAITGARIGEIITPEHVARLLASNDGALKNVGDAVVIPLVNMVDNAHLEARARQIADKTLERGSGRLNRIVLASMRRTAPIVDVIDRS